VKKALVIFSFCLALLPTLAVAQGLDKYIELLRSDLRTQKVELLTDALELTDAQGPKFWPIQREYQVELDKLQDARIAMIKDYAQSYEKMDAAKATSLMNQAFKFQDQRIALIKKYAGKVSKAVSPAVAARFGHTEMFLQSIADVQIQGEVPLVP
jgi:hypothetical protein